MKKKLKFISIGDIHFNNKNAERLRIELEEIFFPALKREKPDMVVFAGDLLDYEVGLGSKAATLAYKLILRTYKIAKCPIIVLQGTKTHDFNQLQILSFLKANLGTDVTVLTKVHEMEFEGASLLFLPEEYPEDWKEYYANYLNFSKEEPLKYHLNFFHGMLDFTAHSSTILESEKFIKSSVVFPSKYFKYTALKSIGNHVHVSQEKNNCYYNGSFSREAHGEESPKGFSITTLDLETNKVNIEFIENTLAPEYQTIKLSEYYDDDVSKMIDSISELDGNIRLLIDREPDEKISANIQILKNHFLPDLFQVKNNFKSAKTMEGLVDENELEEALEKIFDDSTSFEEKVFNAARDRNPNLKKLTLERTTEILSSNKD